MTSPDKKSGISTAETEFSAPKVERQTENRTVAIQPESVGTVETPRRADGNQGEIIKFPENVFLGSEARQQKVKKQSRNSDELNKDLHTAELSSDFVKPNSEGEVYAHREFSYVKTPDGRIHSNKAVLEYNDPKYAQKGEKRVTEERSITPDGMVGSYQRTVEKSNGTNETNITKIGRDAQGKIAVREHSLRINGKEVFRSEQRLDSEDPKKVISVTVLEERHGFSDKPGTTRQFDGGEDFSNEWSGGKLLED